MDEQITTRFEILKFSGFYQFPGFNFQILTVPAYKNDTIKIKKIDNNIVFLKIFVLRSRNNYHLINLKFSNKTNTKIL